MVKDLARLGSAHFHVAITLWWLDCCCGRFWFGFLWGFFNESSRFLCSRLSFCLSCFLVHRWHDRRILLIFLALPFIYYQPFSLLWKCFASAHWRTLELIIIFPFFSEIVVVFIFNNYVGLCIFFPCHAVFILVGFTMVHIYSVCGIAHFRFSVEQRQLKSS